MARVDLHQSHDGRRRLPVTVRRQAAEAQDGDILGFSDGYYQRQAAELVPVAPNEDHRWPCWDCGTGPCWCRRDCCTTCELEDAHTYEAWAVREVE